MALQHPAISRLGQLIDQEEFPTVAYAASRDVLDRTMGKAAEQVNVTIGLDERLLSRLDAIKARRALLPAPAPDDIINV